MIELYHHQINMDSYSSKLRDHLEFLEALFDSSILSKKIFLQGLKSMF